MPMRRCLRCVKVLNISTDLLLTPLLRGFSRKKKKTAYEVWIAISIISFQIKGEVIPSDKTGWFSLENLGKSLFSNFFCYWKKKILIIQGKDKHETFLNTESTKGRKISRASRLVHSSIIVLNSGGHSWILIAFLFRDSVHKGGTALIQDIFFRLHLDFSSIE